MESEYATSDPAPGAAAWTNRNVLRLCPLDKIRNDEEVARILHALDDAEFESQPLAIFFFRLSWRDTVRRDASLEAGLGLAAQLHCFAAVCLVCREPRQDRRAGLRPEGAAPGNLDRRGSRFRQIRKLFNHFLASLEAVFQRDTLALGSPTTRP